MLVKSNQGCYRLKIKHYHQRLRLVMPVLICYSLKSSCLWILSYFPSCHQTNFLLSLARNCRRSLVKFNEKISSTKPSKMSLNKPSKIPLKPSGKPSKRHFHKMRKPRYWKSSTVSVCPSFCPIFHTKRM